MLEPLRAKVAHFVTDSLTVNAQRTHFDTDHTPHLSMPNELVKLSTDLRSTNPQPLKDSP